MKCQASAIRASRRFLEHVRAYAGTAGRLMFLESFIPSLTVRGGLCVAEFPELATIQFRKRWEPAEIDRHNLYRPVKDSAVQAAMQRCCE